VIGQLGNLLNLCAATLPALDVLERNFTALAKGTSTLDDTVVAPSVCQQAWFKMTGLDSLCRAADEKADDIVANCERTAHRASALAQTTVESAERQIWEKYKTSNPEVGELEDPASTNDVNADKDASVAPSAPKNKKLLQMIGMQYAIGSQVNKFAQASGKPGSEMIIVCSPGTIAGDKPLRAITRAPTAVIPTGALALVIDIDFGSSPEDATVVVEPAGKTLAPPAPTSADASVAPEQAAAGSGASAISSMKPASFTPAE